MKNKKYICHTTYLRNNIAYDHDCWVLLCKMTISPVIGQKIMTKNYVALDISGPIDHMIAICGTQVSKMAKNDKKLSPYLKKHTSYDRYFCCTCVKQ